MDSGPTKYFLLTYDLETRDLDIEEFGSADGAAAEAYTELEMEHLGEDSIEVVLVGADSLETIRKTHSHYFPRVRGGLVDELERELTAALGEKY